MNTFGFTERQSRGCKYAELRAKKILVCFIFYATPHSSEPAF
jgi:hypothetical protein